LNVAVSEKAGTVNLSVPLNNTGSAEIVKEDNGKSFIVESIRIDSLEELIGIPIKLLKIDVEGHEYSVLRGAEKLLRSGTIENILIEIWHTSTEKFMENDSVKLLINNGYIPYQVIKQFS
jgi:FkbM family methyltransferase